MTVSVIVPTLGRPSLAATVASIPSHWETIVVADGHKSYIDTISLIPDAKVFLTPWTHDLGHTQRNVGDEIAKGDWLLHLDDDDVYVEDVAEIVEPHLVGDVPVIFQMVYARNGDTLWKQRSMVHGNVGTPMIAVPNREDLPRWPSQASGDFVFIEACVDLMGGPTWVDKVIAIIRPQDAPH